MSRPCYTNMGEEVGTLAMAEIEKEMTPILAHLLTLGPGSHEHPTVRLLFNWLMDPQRTVGDFNHVIGPLAEHVQMIMKEHFDRYMCINNYCCSMYLAKIAAEALAVKNPIIEGSWENASWFVVRLTRVYSSDNYGFASDCLSDWVIRVIGDPDLCPNSYLRFELMNLLLLMVEIKYDNRTQALKSVMSACSIVSMEILLPDPNSDYNFIINLNAITHILEMVDEEDDEFDENLAKKLLSVKTLRISAVLHDVVYHRSVYSSRYAEPSELHTLTALLKTVKRHVKLMHEHVFEKQGIIFDDDLSKITHALYGLIRQFQRSCWQDQLIDLAASCIMDVVEFVIQINVMLLDDGIEVIYRDSLDYINIMLEELDDEGQLYQSDITKTPFVEVIHQKYGGRLSCIKEVLQYWDFSYWRNIYNFVGINYNDL